MRLLATLALTATTTVAIAAPGDFHYVGAEQAQVRAEPKDDAEVKYVVMIGRKVVEFERQGEFVNVGFAVSGSRTGWIRIGDLTSTDPDGFRYNHCIVD